MHDMHVLTSAIALVNGRSSPDVALSAFPGQPVQEYIQAKTVSEQAKFSAVSFTPAVVSTL